MTTNSSFSAFYGSVPLPRTCDPQSIDTKYELLSPKAVSITTGQSPISQLTSLHAASLRYKEKPVLAHGCQKMMIIHRQQTTDYCLDWRRQYLSADLNYLVNETRKDLAVHFHLFLLPRPKKKVDTIHLKITFSSQNVSHQSYLIKLTGWLYNRVLQRSSLCRWDLLKLGCFVTWIAAPLDVLNFFFVFCLLDNTNER